MSTAIKTIVSQKRTPRVPVQIPSVTDFKETEPNGNIFKCSVPSRSFAGITYTVTVRATWYPYTAQCQCPGSHGKCAHKQAAIDAVDAHRTQRWRNRHGYMPLEWALGANEPLGVM
jgi:hypothetical protein